MTDVHHDYDALPTDKCAPSMRQEIRVVVAVVLFVISMEIVARIMAPNIDSDREHIHMVPEIIAESAKEAEREELPNVIFFARKPWSRKSTAPDAGFLPSRPSAKSPSAVTVLTGSGQYDRQYRSPTFPCPAAAAGSPNAGRWTSSAACGWQTRGQTLRSKWCGYGYWFRSC